MQAPCKSTGAKNKTIYNDYIFYMKVETSTFSLDYRCKLEVSPDGETARPWKHFRLNITLGFSIIGGYGSRQHFHAVCFTGFSAMLDLYMGGCNF